MVELIPYVILALWITHTENVKTLYQLIIHIRLLQETSSFNLSLRRTTIVWEE